MFNLKNLRLYRLSRDVKFDTDSLQEKLSLCHSHLVVQGESADVSDYLC